MCMVLFFMIFSLILFNFNFYFIVGKWEYGNMIVIVKIEELKIGDYYIMVVVVDRLNVYEVVFGLLERKSVEYVGMNVDILKEFIFKDVEMYLVFKGNDDYVFMIVGDFLFVDMYFFDCKVFICKMLGKKSVFFVLLEF